MQSRAPILLVGGLFLAVWLLSGCWTLSLHPLCSADTMTFDKRLVGTWKNGRDTAEFAPAGGNKYRIHYTAVSDGKYFPSYINDLEACLVKLGDQNYLDVYPPAEGGEDAIGAHQLSTHSLWQVSLDGDKLFLRPVDFDWLKNMMKEDPKTIGATQVDDDVILLIASTAELQEFVRRHSSHAFKAGDVEPWQHLPAAKQ